MERWISHRFRGAACCCCRPVATTIQDLVASTDLPDESKLRHKYVMKQIALS